MSALPTEDGYYWAKLDDDEPWEVIEIWDGLSFRTASTRTETEFHEIHPTRLTPPTHTTP
jgi:hypothetical protein